MSDKLDTNSHAENEYLNLLGVEVDGELVEVAVELTLDLSEGVGGSLIGGGLIGPVGVHDQPGAIVDIEPLLAHGALVLRVTLHHHVEGGLGNVGGAVTEAHKNLVVSGVTLSLNAHGAVLGTERGLVEVRDANVRLLVPLLTVVLLENEGVIGLEHGPDTSRLLPVPASNTSDLIVVQRDVLIKKTANDGALGPVLGVRDGGGSIVGGDGAVEISGDNTPGAEHSGSSREEGGVAATEHSVANLNIGSMGMITIIYLEKRTR